MHGRQSSKRVRAAAGSALALTLLVGTAACTSQSSSSASAVSAPTVGGVTEAAGTTAAAASAAAPAATSAAAAPSAAPASAPPANNGTLEGRPGFEVDPTAGRSIIYTATLNLLVPKAADVPTQADAAARLAQANNGYVFSRDGQAAATGDGGGAGPGVATADITLKVPPSQFNGLLSALQQLGHPLSINQQSQDVTSKVVDTTARLASQKASVERIRALLAKATTIGQIVLVEGELTKREADLESLEGQLNELKSQTSLATITVHLQSAPTTPVVVPPKPKKKIHGFLGGLAAGGRGFATVAIGTATVTGALLPFVGTLLLVAIIAWLVRRQWLKGRTTRTAPVEQATP